MWIVRLALRRPYTFVVVALLIVVLGLVSMWRMPTDIFPDVDIPVASVVWSFTGISPADMERRVLLVSERAFIGSVNDIERIESQAMVGVGLTRIYFQPGAKIEAAIAQLGSTPQSILRALPPGMSAPLIIRYSASTVPILQLSVASETLPEAVLFDYAQNFVRTQLATVRGASVSLPYGGKPRQIMVDLDPRALKATGLAPSDVVNAISAQNLILPTGTAKIGAREYSVRVNSSPDSVEGLNNLPIKQINGAVVYIRDVAQVRDGYSVQTNIVSQGGRRASLVTIFKSGGASTLDVVQRIKDMVPKVQATLPPELDLKLMFDQSIFVRAAVDGVVREAVIAAGLTALTILIFLGSWRSTLIVTVSIPLSILSSVVVLGFLGHTINIMTLGGLALAVGILVDDATVTIENIERYLEGGRDLRSAILEGAAQIAVPALVSTLCICIVFLPMFFLSGVARYLFVPLAEAVVFAMLASYVLSRTLVPTLAMYLLRPHDHHPRPSRNPLTALQRGFERTFERTRHAYRGLLVRLLSRQGVFCGAFLAACLLAWLLVPWLGENFFPTSDNGQFILHARAKTGTRIEETARLADLVEASIRQEIPEGELDNIIDNIGMPYSTINTIYSRSGFIGAADADILVTLRRGHRPTEDHVRALRRRLPEEFPGVTFYFVPADIVTQILNFGLPAPIDVQIEGSNLEGNRQVANKMMAELRQVPGLTDLRIQQTFDSPRFEVSVDRTKAAGAGFTPRDVANSVLLTLSGSGQTNPATFLNWQNGVSYSLVTQAPQYSVQSLQDLQNIPLGGATPTARPQILGDVASIERGSSIAVVSHYNTRRVVDIYGSVQDRDLGAVGRDIARIVEANRPHLPRGSFMTLRGQVETMRASYLGLLGGLAFAIVLVYLLIVVNFQS